MMSKPLYDELERDEELRLRELTLRRQDVRKVPDVCRCEGKILAVDEGDKERRERESVCEESEVSE